MHRHAREHYHGEREREGESEREIVRELLQEIWMKDTPAITIIAAAQLYSVTLILWSSIPHDNY